jgi:outer membrane protein assembly factor BamE (lipoprotein component of BamABCDE complex)
VPTTTLRAAFLLSCAAALPACQQAVVTRGHQLDARRVETIVPGVTTKREVERVMGSPSAVATFDDRNWYYISQRYERANFFADSLTAQDVVAVRFDDKGVVVAVDQHGLDAAQAVEPDPDVTPTTGNDRSLVQEFIGNIGRFNTETPSTGGATGSRVFRDRRPGGGI